MDTQATTQTLAQRLSLVDKDDELIDRIIYLGSLASAQKAIDSIIEPLREITAHRQPGAELSEEDRRALADVELKLRHFLVAEDPLRTFNEQTLDERLSHSDADKTVYAKPTTNSQSFIGAVLLSVATASLAFALPTDWSPKTRFFVGVPLFFVVLHVCIAYFYLSALGNFKDKARRAITLISVGVVMLSLGFSHYVGIQLFGLDSYDFMKYGGITWLFGIPFVFIYLGVRSYAWILNIKSRAMSLGLVGGLVAATGLVVVVLPHPPVNDPFFFSFFVVGAAMIPLFALLASIIMNRITHQVTATHARPMKWLYRYSIMVGLGGLGATVALFALGGLHGEALAWVTAIFGVPPQLILLYTGYMFKREASR